ncbi:MAG: exopolysaccharide biosynthesis protein, partial [Chlamydiae bacterium]|nr:exopolysaccharide biosynthesis protein [Chlamydiota bacterium]
MKKNITYRNLEDTFRLFLEKSKKGSISLERVLKILSGKGKDFIIMLLAIPFCLPVQIPGLSIPFGIVIALMGLRVLIGGNVILPKKISQKQIPAKTMKRVAQSGIWIIKKFKRFVRPRMEQFCHSPIFKRINGLVIIILGLVLALPLPIPFTNLIAAWTLFLLTLGLLEDDGLLVIFSYAGLGITFFA